MTTEQKIKKIEEIVAAATPENLQELGDVKSVSVSFYGDAVRFTNPDASRKYSDIGSINFSTGSIKCMGVPVNSFKPRTTDEKGYLRFMEKIRSAIQ